MNKLFFLFTLNLFINVALFAQDARKYTTHVVKEGETLKSISKIYDCKVKELKNLNPDIDEDELLINTTLVVPNNISKNIPKKTPEKNEIISNSAVKYYIVESSNTLFYIAKKFNVTIQSIIEANNLKDDTLQPGQKLRIPSQSEFMVKPSEKKAEFYQVKKGDTKWRIATLYNISVDELNQLNPELQGDELKEGEYIWVPNTEKQLNEEVKETYKQEQSPDFIYHVVMEGEGLFKIAVIYETTQEEIEKLNPEAVKLLRPGMLLKIPGKKKDKFITHVVEKGDTIYNLCNKYDVTEEYLLLNNTDLKDGLKLGTTIFIKPINNREEAKNKTIFKFIGKPKSDEIKLSYLLPIMSDSVISFQKSKLKTINADFYLGAQIALEELAEKGIKVDAHVYDTKNDKQTINKLVKQNDVASSDIIIGDFFIDNSLLIAKNLPDVPVFLPFYSKKQDSITAPNLIKSGNDESISGATLAKYLSKKHSGEKIVLISDFTEKNLSDAKEIEAYFNEKKLQYIKIEVIRNEKDNSIINVKIPELISLLNEEIDTWVILLSDNSALNADVVNAYSNAEIKITKLFTNDMFEKKWQPNYSNLAKLNWTFISAQFADFQNPEIKKFQTLYKEKNFATPSEYAFTGYDLTMDAVLRYESGNLIKDLGKVKTIRFSRVYDYRNSKNDDLKNEGFFVIQFKPNYNFEIVE